MRACVERSVVVSEASVSGLLERETNDERERERERRERE
jgi:hypothetical protein